MHATSAMMATGQGVSLQGSQIMAKGWNALRMHPIVVECRDAIFGAVLGQGITATGNTNAPPDAEFTRIMRDYYEPAARAALEWLIVVGVVPVRFERPVAYTETGEDVVVPIVPEAGAVDVTVIPPTFKKGDADSCRTRYICYPRHDAIAMLSDTFGSIHGARAEDWRPFQNHKATKKARRTKDEDTGRGADGDDDLDGSNDDPGFIVMQFSAPPPTCEGQLCTPLASCVTFLDDIERLRCMYEHAVNTRAHPTVHVVQTTPRGANQSESMPSLDLIAGNVTNLEEREIIDRIRVEYMETQPHTATHLRNSGAPDGAFAPFAQDRLTQKALEQREAERERYIFLPRNHTYVDTRLPEPPQDYARLLHEHEDKIRRTLGVAPGGGTRLTTADAAHSNTNATRRSRGATQTPLSNVNAFVIARHRKDVNSFLQRCYEICRSLSHATAPQYTESIALMPSPFIDIDAVRSAHDDGVIDTPLYKRCVDAMLSNVT